jgi:hypothetical protein
MPTLSTKLTTRVSNANKHPGVPDQMKKKHSPAQMAAIRASEKAAKEAKAAAVLAAPLIIAGVEDSMDAADKDKDCTCHPSHPSNTYFCQPRPRF